MVRYMRVALPNPRKTEHFSLEIVHSGEHS